MSSPPNVSWPGDPVLDPVGEQDHPRAGPEDRHPLGDPLAQRLEQLEGPGQLRHRRRLPAREHEAVALLELGRPAYGEGAGAELVEHPEVLADVALEGEDADGGGHDAES